MNGINEYIKSLTITNMGSVGGSYTLTIERESGIELNNLRYALVVNGIIWVIDDIPNDGVIFENILLKNETIDFEIHLWPKSSYIGGITTFTGNINEEFISIIPLTASEYFNSIDEISTTQNYALFNCNNGANCEIWRIVKVENNQVVLTKNYVNGAFERVNAYYFTNTIDYHDQNDLVVSESTDKKNVYLATTAILTGGDGTAGNPFTFDNIYSHYTNIKAKAILTYEDDGTYATQPIYMNRTNYISHVYDGSNFVEYSDGVNRYHYGSVFDYSVNTTVEAVIQQTLSSKIHKKVNQNVNYIASYDTVLESNADYNTQDTYSAQDADKETVYYFTGVNAKANSNVIMGGFCWQIIRTTDNGSIKLLYNGVADNNMCRTDRSATSGIIGTSGQSQYQMDSLLTYGDSFDYDLTTGIFTLNNTFTETWSGSTYQNLIGKWTCMDSSNTTCTTIYYVGTRFSDTHASVVSYTINNTTNYSSIGKSPFNATNSSVAMAGYMFNKSYGKKVTNGHPSGTYMSDVEWTGSNYQLKTDGGTTSNDLDDTHHYYCDDVDCIKVRFYSAEVSHVLLTNGDIDPLKVMINYKTNSNASDENINVYDSSIKGVVDNWYVKNLSSLESLFDKETVYCNDRSTEDVKGWNKTSPMSTDPSLLFRYSNNYNDLNCANMTDRFSAAQGNTIAHLTYPIGLLTFSERVLMGSNFTSTGSEWVSMAPRQYNYDGTSVRTIFHDGLYGSAFSSASKDVRPVIAIKDDVEYSRGVGSYDDPYVIVTS